MADQLLGNYALQALGKHGAHHFFFARREYVNDSVDRFRCTNGVERRKDKVAGFCGRQGKANRVGVAHFADLDNVRVFPHGVLQCGLVAPGMTVDLALGYQAVNVLMQVFDRVFQGQDVGEAGAVDVINHGGQGGRFSGAGGAGDNHEAAWAEGQGGEDGGGGDFGEGGDRFGNEAHSQGWTALGGVGVDTEATGGEGVGVGEVGGGGDGGGGDVGCGKDGAVAVDFVGVDGGGAGYGEEVTQNTQARRGADGKVNVGRIVVDGGLEDVGECGWHGFSG